MKKMLVTSSNIIASTLDMNMKQITSVADPEQSYDAANKHYVDESILQVESEVKSYFQGIVVALKGTDFTDIANIRSGSYILTATPYKDGYTTASWSISKSSAYSHGHTFRITGEPGSAGEFLDLEWQLGGMLRIRKTMKANDGSWIIDMNVKNYSNLKHAPIIPDDTASKAYVDHMIKETLDVKFGGKVVYLEGTEPQDVFHLRNGSYIISVSAMGLDGAPTATFCISKNSIAKDASITKITSCPGTFTPEESNIDWPPYGMLRLFKSGPGYNGSYLVDINLKNMSATLAPPIFPNDSATIDYVDQKIAQAMEARFGGEVVELVGTDKVNVANLKNGSYVVSVSSQVPNAPTACFTVSKNSPYAEPSIVRTSSCSGKDTNEILELHWDDNSMLSLSKNGAHYDGTYIVDFNLKNISVEKPVPVFESDVATKIYVDERIKDNITAQWGGISVDLVDTDWSNVCALKSGSYLVNIIPTKSGNATASFVISKSLLSEESSIVQLSSMAGKTGEKLELDWPPNAQLRLKKDQPFGDGTYIVDLNMKNFSTIPPPVIESDVASKEYVDRTIQESMDVRFSGVLVDLIDTEWSAVYALKPGSYMISISATFDGGSSATFHLSKSSQWSEANIQRTTSAPGYLTDEVLEIDWPANSKLMCRKTNSHHNGRYLVNFNMKNFESIPPPVLPTDVANKSFVDKSIEDRMNAKFGGILVTLETTEFAPVQALRPGSYVIAISSLVRGGPAATFLLSKSTETSRPSVFKATDSPGSDELTHLEIDWPDNSRLLIRKTTPFYSGQYLVDFNLKNFTELPPPVLPSDIASKDYVDEQVKNASDVRWGGIEVTLVDDTYVAVEALRTGSYVVAVTPKKDGCPTAVFNISKSSLYTDGTVVVTSSSCGLDTGETLEMRWPPNDRIYLRKTGPFHDGMYVVDFNMKNFSTLPLPTFPNEAANKAYVDEAIKEQMQTQYGGIVVTLKDKDLVPVFPMKPGSYVFGVSSVKNGPTATFSLSKSKMAEEGTVAMLTSCPGEENCQLEMVWPSNGKICLRKTNFYDDGDYIIDCNLKNLSSLHAPVIPSDNATKEYVDENIQSKLDEKFSGIVVNLKDDEISDVVMLRPGSYVVTVSPIGMSGPTAVFNLSRGSTYVDGNIARTSSSSIGNDETQIEIFWLAGEKLRIRKTSQFWDGNYLIDFNLKNFSTVPPPVIPSDMVTKEYLDNELETRLNAKFAGVVIRLEDDEYVDVFPLRQGSYFISVSPLITGGAPTATFLISRSSAIDEPSIVKVTSVNGKETGETLELAWQKNKKLQLRKTGGAGFYSGDYLVDCNLRNFSDVPIPEIPTDIATKEYVDESIKDTLDAKFSGILVNLNGTGASPVTALRFGTYFVVVSSKLEGAPTAAFIISKNSNVAEPHVVEITSSPGDETGEQLHISWDPNRKVYLSKDGPFWDGDYIVDFNTKNFSNIPPPVLPSDSVSMYYVNKTIAEALKVKFGGITVNLKSSEFTDVTLVKNGSYVVSVSCLNPKGPTACFTISKSSQNKDASVVRQSSCPSEDDENGQLELVWRPNEKIRIRKTTAFNDGAYLVDFNLKNFSNAPSPQLPDDVASKEYVDNLLEERLNIMYSGISVDLFGTNAVDVTPLRVGSYTISVICVEPGAPTATFHVSKNLQNMEGHVIVISKCKGVDGDTDLNLTWNPNEQLQLSKTSAFYDGRYIVEFSVKNFATSVNPTAPSDLVTKDYVDAMLKTAMDRKFYGVSVQLSGTERSPVVNLQDGSYVLSVAPSRGCKGACAIFAITRNQGNEDASVVVITSSPGSTNEQLGLDWNPDGTLYMYKSDIGNDGTYVVDMNLKNISSNDHLILSSSSPSDEKDSGNNIGKICNSKDANLSNGVDVFLRGIEYSNVISLKPGSYLLAIRANDLDGAPTATFSISKSSSNAEASIARLTDCASIDNLCHLELTWKDSVVRLRKTSLNFDGMYKIDTNMRNVDIITVQETSNSGISSLQSSVKTGIVREYHVNLTGTDPLDLTYLASGTYMCLITYTDPKIFSATLVLSKPDEHEGTVLPMNIYSNVELPFGVEVIWNGDNLVQISKNKDDYDGMYMIKFV